MLSARTLLLALVLGSAPALLASAAEPCHFQMHVLTVDLNEGCDVGDIDGDGRPDVVAGRNWYRNPDWTPRPVRAIADVQGYAESNGEFLFDVNQDGRLDVVAGTFFQGEICWYENPGGEELLRGNLWKRRTLANSGVGSNEFTMLHDMDGDGVPEWIANSWMGHEPLRIWRWERPEGGDAEKIRLVDHVLGGNHNGHGMGFGDLNNDGREDVIVGTGWYERPEGDPWGQKWEFHADWNTPLSCPVVVRDVNGDGKNDLVWGSPHHFGLRVWLATGGEGETFRYLERMIDDSYSQLHALHMADLDGDGREELITGKRVRAHNGNDPGGKDPPLICYYKIDEEGNFSRHDIQRGLMGIGLQIRTADLNGDGKLDIVVAGKDGTQLLIQQ